MVDPDLESGGIVRRQRLIVVCGLGGTGKTTLATALSQRLNTVCLHKDSMKAALHDLDVVTSRSFDLFTALVEEQLAVGVDLIAEATFHGPGDRGLLARWQADHHLDLVCVVCGIDAEERRRRILGRVRHPAHAEADSQQLREPQPMFDAASLPGRVIPVLTDRSVDECVEAVLGNL